MKNLLVVTEAALENPNAVPLSEADKGRYNGVVRTYENILPLLTPHFNVHSLTPFDYQGAPESNKLKALIARDTPFDAPFQDNIRLVLPSACDLVQRMAVIRPDHVHVATEGPLGQMALLYCKKHDIPTSSAFHTNWQDYVTDPKTGVPALLRPGAGLATRAVMKWFHKQTDAIMAATPDLKKELAGWGLPEDKIHIVSRGIDSRIFRPYPDEERPVADEYVVCVGRVSFGKGVERFCALDTGNLKKVVVGEGTLLNELKAKHPDVIFAGFKGGAELGRYFSAAKFFVMPSETETFGMTVTESLGCGTPVIAFERGGHAPILTERAGLGLMGSDLQKVFDEAVRNPSRFMPKSELSAWAHQRRSWDAEAENFRSMVTAAHANHFKVQW